MEILTEPKNALVRQYRRFFEMEGAELEFTPAALKAVARRAMTLDTGARALRNVIEDFMLELMYDLPEMKQPNARYVITQEMIESDQKLSLTKALKKKKESA